jgi:hypothetical protein
MAQNMLRLLESMKWHFRSYEEIKNTSLFTKVNYTLFFMILTLAVVAVLQTRAKIVREPLHSLWTQPRLARGSTWMSNCVIASSRARTEAAVDPEIPGLPPC